MSRVKDILLAVVLAATVPASAATLFDVSVELTSAGPPYPTSPTQTKLFQGSLPDPARVGMIDMGIHNVSNAPLAAYMRAWDPAGGPGALSASSFFDVFLAASQLAPAPTTSSFFDIWMQPLTHDGQPGSIPSGSGGFVGGGGGGSHFSHFDVSVNVVTDDGGPRLIRLHGEVPSGQPAHFASGSTIQMIDGKLHIIPKLVFDGEVNSGLPLFTTTMTPEPASMFLLLTGAGLLRRRSTR